MMFNANRSQIYVCCGDSNQLGVVDTATAPMVAMRLTTSGVARVLTSATSRHWLCNSRHRGVPVSRAWAARWRSLPWAR